jgi:hypothetical protein
MGQPCEGKVKKKAYQLLAGPAEPHLVLDIQDANEN